MINYIKQILKENSYDVYDENKSRLFLNNTRDNRSDYYVLFDMGSFETVDKLKKLIKESEEYYFKFKEKFEDIDKNTTALYLLNVSDSNMNKELWYFLCETEEIVQFMKRNILYYNDQELKYISSIEKSNELSGEIIARLKDYELFNLYKNEREKYEAYSILSKIFIKLNCLTYDFDQKNGFESLNSEIMKKVNSSTNNNMISDCDYIVEKIDCIISDKTDLRSFYADYSKEIDSRNADSVNKRVEKRVEEMIYKIGKEM